MTSERNRNNEEGYALPKSAPSAMRRSLHQIITEEDFKEPVTEMATRFFRLADYILYEAEDLSSRFYSNLMNEAEKLETFLDDYGARENHTWYHFSELIASIRNFAVAGFELSHILIRYMDYFPDDEGEDSDEFYAHSMEVMTYIGGIEKSLITEARLEIARLGCHISETDIKPQSFSKVGKLVKLPRNLSKDPYNTSESRVMQIVESYRKIAIKMRRDKYGNMPEPAEMALMIPTRINETMVKIMENALHTIQSEYDTHIRQTGMEKSDPDLLKFRSYISVPMHLLEMARWIIHFYERHENEIHSDTSHEKISKIVDKDLVLKLLSQYAFYYANKYMSDGKPISERIMSRFMLKDKVTLPIPQPGGFHARPAYYITLVVEEHGTDVFMMVGDRKFDCRSVLDLLEAGGHTVENDVETVDFIGDKRTLKDLRILADNNYCEDETIPKALNYIRVARNIVT